MGDNFCKGFIKFIFWYKYLGLNVMECFWDFNGEY